VEIGQPTGARSRVKPACDQAGSGERGRPGEPTSLPRARGYSQLRRTTDGRCTSFDLLGAGTMRLHELHHAASPASPPGAYRALRWARAGRHRDPDQSPVITSGRNIRGSPTWRHMLIDTILGEGCSPGRTATWTEIRSSTGRLRRPAPGRKGSLGEREDCPDSPKRAESEARAATGCGTGSSFGAAAEDQTAEHRPATREAAVRARVGRCGTPARFADRQPVRVATSAGAGTGKMTATMAALGARR